MPSASSGLAKSQNGNCVGGPTSRRRPERRPIVIAVAGCSSISYRTSPNSRPSGKKSVPRPVWSMHHGIAVFAPDSGGYERIERIDDPFRGLTLRSQGPMPKKRGRLTRQLLSLAEWQVAGCNLCSGHKPQLLVEELGERLRFRRLETKRLVRSLMCPQCEAGPHIYDTIAEYEPNELADVRRSRRWSARYERRLMSLVELLERTPSLGLADETGRLLQTAARRARIVSITSNPWWRGCCKNTAAAPPPARFLPADPHVVKIPAQRFNHAGQRALYVSDSPETAAGEILREEEGRLWMAQLSFQRPLRLLDIRVSILGDGSTQGVLLAGLNLSAPTKPDDAAPREYVLTRFIADLVRRRPTADGIVFTSSRRLPFGANVVLLRDVPVVVTGAPALYRWSWTMCSAPFDMVRSHMVAEPV